LLIVLRSAGLESDHDVSFEAAATAADLLNEFGGPDVAQTIRIDTRRVEPDTPLAAIPLRHGSLVELNPEAHGDAGFWLEATGGPAAGSRALINRYGLRVGRSSHADLTLEDPRLAPLHFSVRRVNHRDAELTDLGTAEGTRRRGDLLSAGDSTFRLCGPSDAVEQPEHPQPLDLPEAPAPLADPQPLPWLSISAPMALGIGLAMLIHPMMLLMGLMSPVMLLAGWAERRRMVRREGQKRKSAWQLTLKEFQAHLDGVRAATIAWERARFPDPASLLRSPILAPADLAPADHAPSDHGSTVTVATGITERPWDPDFAGSHQPHPDVSAIIAATGSLPDLPLLTVLRAGDRVSVVGPRPQAESLCRWLIIQVALARRDSELSMHLSGEHSDSDWAWTARLAHFTSASPNQITIGIDVPDPTITFVYGHPFHTDGLPTGVAAELARRISRSHSNAAAAELPSPGLSLSSTCTDVGTTPGAILGNWQHHHAEHLPTVLGIGREGPALIDLVAAGPHALIAGTTGSGKSELLRTLVVTMAIRVSPAHVNFVLIDYKGGSAFDACARLPHVVGIVTDLDSGLAERALRCLGSEIRRREAVLRAAHLSDIAELPPGALPRLCVVIDELAGLVADLPLFTDGLIGIAQRGRSLGVHLILATQRPSGAVTPAVRANTNLRICLRVPDPFDSDDVIGCALAAQIPRGLPGRAWVRTGPDELSPIQGIDTSAPLLANRPVLTRPWGLPTCAEGSSAEEPTGLDVLVAATDAAWRNSGGATPLRPWPDPLPESVALDDLPLATTGVAIGLIDDPDDQQVKCLSWDRRLGHLVVAGGPRSGRTTALATAATAIARSPGTEFLGIDAAGGDLAALASLNHCGAVHDLADVETIGATLDDLMAQARGLGDVNRRSVLIIDGLGTLLAALETCRDFAFMAALARFWTDGPSRGISCVVSVDRPGAVPNAMAAATAETIVLPLSNPFDYLPGAHGEPPRSTKPGRGHSAGSGRIVQIAQLPCQ
jgi:S-DNA-T family DNA segregation ATPase FtsK/SpoIIIE